MGLGRWGASFRLTICDHGLRFGVAGDDLSSLGPALLWVFGGGVVGLAAIFEVGDLGSAHIEGVLGVNQHLGHAHITITSNDLVFINLNIILMIKATKYEVEDLGRYFKTYTIMSIP
jgi:hypothetical protein